MIEAIEAELGINPSGADATVAATLAALSSRYGAVIATYAPALSNIAEGTGGTPVNTASYTYSGGRLTVEGRIRFGTTGRTFPNNVSTIALPAGYTITTLDLLRAFGTITYNGGGGFRMGRFRAVTVSTLALHVNNTDGTQEYLSTPSVTAPHAWATGDELNYEYSVRATGP